MNISPGTTSIGMNENAGQCLVKVGDTLRITYSDRSTAMAKIMYNQSHDQGLTWGTPVQLFTSLNCGFTAIASSGSNVHIVWMDSLGSDRASYYRRSLDGGVTWDPIICLDSVTKFWPGIACSGNLVIATLNKDLAGNTEVFIKRSLDNGSTWLPEQQISNAPNRSEDPAITMLGNDVHLSWNDKRSGIMNIYYCHSADGGATWGTETGLTTTDSYTSMVCADGNHVDVPHGLRIGTTFDLGLAESADTGTTWPPNQLLTNTPALSELYPFMVRDGLNMHLVHIGPGGTNYIHSADGGTTWDAPLLLGASNGQPFIAYTACALHVIFGNAGAIYYMRNPIGNCPTVGVNSTASANSGVKVYPNPASDEITVNTSDNEPSEITLYDLTSRELFRQTFTNSTIVNIEKLSTGIYIYKMKSRNGILNTGKVVKD